MDSYGVGYTDAGRDVDLLYRGTDGRDDIILENVGFL